MGAGVALAVFTVIRRQRARSTIRFPGSLGSPARNLMELVGVAIAPATEGPAPSQAASLALPMTWLGPRQDWGRAGDLVLVSSIRRSGIGGGG
jgi:hypothetical protein